MSRELYEELHEELTQELTEERYKELREKAQKLFLTYSLSVLILITNQTLTIEG